MLFRSRDGNWYVDTNLAGFDLVLKAARRGSGAGEDGGAVPVFVGIDEVNGLVDCFNVEADEDGTEDLFGVALHVWLDVCDDGRSDLRQRHLVQAQMKHGRCGTYPVAISIFLIRRLLATPVKQYRSALLLGASNEILNPLLRLRTNHRT